MTASRVHGYQFPELIDEPYDADWLDVRVHVTHPSGVFSRIKPCLLTFEVQRLIEWIRTYPSSTVEALHFLEPCLSLEAVDGRRLRVRLAHGLAPDWATAGAWSEEFEFGPDKRSAAEEALRLACERFPVRVPLG